MVQVLCPVIVGRDAELRALDAALDAVSAGAGGCVVAAGEAGIGKSRLARELASRAAARGLRVVAGRAVPSSMNTPYRPLAEVLLQLSRDEALLHDLPLRPWLPALTGLLPGLTGDAASAEAASAPARGEAVLQLLGRVAPEGAVVVLEDLHWADPDTVAVVEYLADHATGQRALLLFTTRMDAASPARDLTNRLRGRPGVTRLLLDRLDAEAVSEMVRLCTGRVDAGQLDRVRRAADGVPLLVEELLASPGVPESFAGTVRERLAELAPADREALEAAAVLGRSFDWEWVAEILGRPPGVVGDALTRAADLLLLVGDGGGFRFRHALTREAILSATPPPRQRLLARAALGALDGGHAFPGAGRDVTADLALRAGDPARAAVLLTESGRDSLALGALATAIAALGRAAALLDGGPRRADAELLLVEALALAGRVDEAVAVGGRLIRESATDPAGAGLQSRVHLQLAEAAVAAARWSTARHELAADRQLAANCDAEGDGEARLAAVEAELALAAGDPARARALVETVAAAPGLDPALRCHAFELVGRAHRARRPAAAQAAFERALATAEEHGLPLWRLRALHELGTIDMLQGAETARLSEARRAAESSGAVSTVAVLDLQLCAAFTCRWSLDAGEEHGLRARSAAERLGLAQVRAKALAMLTGVASMRADLEATDQLAARTIAAAPDDRMLEGFCWGSRGLCLLLAGDTAAAMEPYARGVAVLSTLPYAEPAALRAVWPVLLAATGDRRARHAIEEAQALGVAAFRMNEGLLGYAEAVLAGSGGAAQRADRFVASADPLFVNCGPWRHLARLLAAPAALAGGWGDPRAWLAEAEAGFADRGLPAMAARCRQLLPGPPPAWAAAGVTAREGDVLHLVAAGLTNQQIATRLRLSPRTVEKHVESLLRKTGTRSRTELAVATSAGSSARSPAT